MGITCRHCRYYTPEGRRGGQCQQLSAPVSGGWKACSLAIPPFAPSWELQEGLMDWSDSAIRWPAVMVKDRSPSSAATTARVAVPAVVEPQALRRLSRV
ncbi:hypothetical protein [Neosynechococcus sphagnicola]|uniref:hypothetical protein n=1 Tax=Neosynechococcus sphagnicola TaxID=1501145 RepID=UPI00138E5372|nr:hypothetical protein [Neosynechococcus sphagnicola]